jgi:hypothetical protein
LDFVHEVQDALDDDPEFDLTGVCEANEIYVVAGEKGLKQESPRGVVCTTFARSFERRESTTARFIDIVAVGLRFSRLSVQKLR